MHAGRARASRLPPVTELLDLGHHGPRAIHRDVWCAQSHNRNCFVKKCIQMSPQTLLVDTALAGWSKDTKTWQSWASSWNRGGAGTLR